jgi:DNA-binding LytR/AlgR family response regulator
MKILSTDAEKLKALERLLAATGVRMADRPDVTLAPRGVPVPPKGVTVVYDEDHPEELVDFLASFQAPGGAPVRDMIVGKRKNGYAIVPLRDVQYFVAWGNFVYCQTAGERFEVNWRLFEIERDFKSRYFFRIHKSYVININWVREIIPWFGGRLLIKMKETDEEVEVSRNYVKAFKESLGI